MTRAITATPPNGHSKNGASHQQQQPRKSSTSTSRGTWQLLMMLFLASSGVLMSAYVFHNSDNNYHERIDPDTFSMHKEVIQEEKPQQITPQAPPPPPPPVQQTPSPTDPPQAHHDNTGNNDEKGGITAVKTAMSASPQLTSSSPPNESPAPTNPESVSQKSLPSSLLEKCTSLNSKEWLRERMPNSQQGHLTPEMAYTMILNTPPLLLSTNSTDSNLLGGSMHFLLRQTLCHEKSRFLNWTDNHHTSIKYWSLRLFYLSFHIHQHKHARREAQLRKDLNCQDVLQSSLGIGPFDYECPTAKFLVVPMGEMGLGAVMRLGAVNALIAGMATNRTVLLVNNATVGDKSVRKPWIHASCSRGDIQCFFMPPTPCTITHDELANAKVLVRGEARKMFKFGELPPGYETERVVVANFVLRPKHVAITFIPNVVRQVKEIIQHVRESVGNNDKRIALMERAIHVITDDTPFDKESKYYYSGVESQPHHAAVFYAMRPNPHYAQRLDDILSQVVPPDFDAERSFGLPVRASDKCLVESECLAFPQYMKLMGQLYNQHMMGGNSSSSLLSVPSANTSIVLTTESQSVLRDMHAFESNVELRQSVPFAYRFVTNHHDVMQSTGLPANFMKRTEDVVTADDIMLSAVSSLKVQLMAKYTVGNCCSNFHLLLFDFLQDGCGAARYNVGQCLQDNKDAEFRVCCMWSKSDECKAKSEARKAKEEAAKKQKEQEQQQSRQRRRGKKK